MNTAQLLRSKKQTGAWVMLLALLLICVAAVLIASIVQRDFGRVSVSNVKFPNSNGIPIRAKLFVPRGVSNDSPAPGVVATHGYQTNRETTDPYSIELARRGFVVLEIDAIGRGNSGQPGDQDAPGFDLTYGLASSIDYLENLPYVKADSVGLIGFSIGGELSYKIALEDPEIRAVVFSGNAYTSEATPEMPKNMLMIYGKYDEYRQRMTGVKNVESDWMSSPQTQAAFPVSDPQFGLTYGDFAAGTARKVVLLPVLHNFESHNRVGTAAAVEWMRDALQPNPDYWIDAMSQTWQIKEVCTLFALMAGFGMLIPLGLILIRTRWFAALQGQAVGAYTASRREFLRIASINGLFSWLYLPLIFALFGLHVYLVRIDKVFPMMLVNGIVWWLVLTKLFGLFSMRGWFKKRAKKDGLSWADLGISFAPDRFRLDWKAIGKTGLLAVILTGFVVLAQYVLERVFIVDWRFIFPIASDLTPYRALMFLLYLPFVLFAFIMIGCFLHGQLRLKERKTWLGTFLSWSGVNILAMIVPLLVFMLFQYVPLFVAGVVPFTGPGGVLANFTMGLMQIILMLIIITPISTWFHQLTGRPYLGAFVNAILVTWIFTSAQVIAPIPI